MPAETLTLCPWSITIQFEAPYSCISPHRYHNLIVHDPTPTYDVLPPVSNWAIKDHTCRCHVPNVVYPTLHFVNASKASKAQPDQCVVIGWRPNFITISFGFSANYQNCPYPLVTIWASDLKSLKRLKCRILRPMRLDPRSISYKKWLVFIHIFITHW